jgi:asparagine synthase (glutamine-hydrolysing)
VLRCDRGVSSNGLEARVPYLDHKLVDYVLSINKEYRRPTHGIEKYLLRRSFEGHTSIPRDILYRPKEAFSDGISSQKSIPWYKTDQFYQLKYTLPTLRTTLHTVTPNHLLQNGEESIIYRMIFDIRFGTGDVTMILPEFWMPRWVDEKSDPSARSLPIYNLISSGYIQDNTAHANVEDQLICLH